MNNNFMRIMSRILITSVLSLSLWMPGAQAGLISTEQAITGQNAQHERERVLTMLDRADVRAGLQARGVNADAAKARVDALTDAEVASLSGKLDQLPAGGDGIIEALIFIFIILLFTDIMGFTKVFPFTKSINNTNNTR
ncbi:MAG: PA2779 family protein [Pseudomonadota bacterium]